MTLFADSYAALAVLTAVCGKAEIILLFAGAVFAVILDFGALTVLYYRFSQSRREQEDSAKRYPVRRRTEAFMRIVPGDHAEVAALIFRRTCGNSSVFNF